jgi:hypothetical protein
MLYYDSLATEISMIRLYGKYLEPSEAYCLFYDIKDNLLSKSAATLTGDCLPVDSRIICTSQSMVTC